MGKILTTVLILLLSLTMLGQKPQLAMMQVATGLDSPVDIRNCGDARIFVVEQHGRISIMDKQGNINPVPFLDISSRVLTGGNEQGLLSLAFSPHYKTDSSFYVNYTTGSGSGSTVISRFKVSATDSNVADPASERQLLTFPQPYINHNGATLLFGRDGYLYDTQGDGGSAGDPAGNGQNKNVFWGKILRIDVSGANATYSVPATNPFVGDANAKPEVWAYGLRNPWRCTMDRITADLWIADVGQDSMEEVNFQPASSTGGENYGWRCYEGTHPYNLSGCTAAGFVPPIYEYKHSTSNGCSITGGNVYRGTKYNRMFGRYFFTDFCSGRFWTAQDLGGGSFVIDTFPSHLMYQYGTFGEDNDYELYIAARTSGVIYHIVDTSSCAPVAFISSIDSTSTCHEVTMMALTGDSLGYQWYGATGALRGAVSSSYTATQTGWYHLQVSAPHAGCQAVSDSIYLTVSPCVSVTDVGGDLRFTIAPNPNRGVFNLTMQSLSAVPLALTIVDALGRFCYQQRISPADDGERIQLDLSSLAKGVYSVNLRSYNQSNVRRLVIE
ncbi:MAG: PQQ-dependent sugar dehydrogenase [Bacteroidetes bacterium]|nr:PQQ-dependent sugar dehydrogenase [Bacteroidota bacterium]